ncbi:MAG: YitT family protein [Clostridia bacterium]|nr:YitT family protein [Clostridia bacterium]
MPTNEGKKKILKEAEGYFFMLVACLAYALSTDLFLAKNSIVAGGVTGLSVLIHLLNEKLPIGMISIAINIPILILGIKMMGWKFILKCLLTITVLGVFTDLLSFLPAMTDDYILASLYGGLCQGIGIGLFVRYEYSSGGTELLGRVVSRWTKVLKIPVCVGILDGIIVVLGAIVTKNPNNMLYALIVIFVSTKISEILLVGVEKSKLCIIISDKGEEISKTLIEQSPRGVTMLDGQGMYTHKEHNVLLTCVKNHQLTQLKKIVKGIDEHAFIIINESVEVRGQGFQSLNEEK